MNGFAGRTFRIIITAGVSTDLGTVRLATSFAMTLTGKVTDASTGAPIPDAELAVAGSNLAARTDFAGTYVIADINETEFTLQAFATGYTGQSYVVGKSPWTQTLDISLTPQVTTGSLTGVVVDAATMQPLSGVP